MILSMTGFGRGEARGTDRQVTADIRSVNSRYRDVQVRLPRTVVPLEARIRQLVSDRFSRGKIEVFISVDDESEDNQIVRYNVSLARSYAEALRKIGQAIGSMEEVSLMNVADCPEVVAVERAQDDPEDIWVLVQEALTKAMDAAQEMKAAEGQKLTSDVIAKLEDLEQCRQQLIERAPSVPDAYRQRLLDRIDVLLGEQKDDVMDPVRLANEIALYADKCAIDEELVRLDSHFSQFHDALSKGGSVGKKLDFIVQEINREINTVGSKASDIEITNRVIHMKSELEKIREQIQNIE